MTEVIENNAMDRAARGHPLSIVTFHAISNDHDPYATTPAMFRRQIAQLSARYSIIRLSEVEQVLREPATGPRRVVLTFDDAYRDFHSTAYPILSEFGVPATVFVPSGRIGGCNEWDAPHGRIPRRPIMSVEELRELQKTGNVEFGSHSVDHVSMAALPIPEMQRQAGESKRALEEILSAEVATFSYPYGQLRDFSEASGKVLADVGYRVAVTSHWGTVGKYANRFRLPRIYFQNEDSSLILNMKVRGFYNWIARKERAAHLVREMLAGK